MLARKKSHNRPKLGSFIMSTYVFFKKNNVVMENLMGMVPESRKAYLLEAIA